MSETLSSGLTITIPTEGDENWASSIKALCFQKISEHDHTGGGKGVQIGTTALAASAVTTAKIADSNVTTAKIADANVTAAKLASDAVTTAKIADANVTQAKMAANSVGTSQLVDGSVGTTKLFDECVTTAKLANGSVTEAKLADDAATRSTILAEFFYYNPASGGVVSQNMKTTDNVTSTYVNLVETRMPKGGRVTHLTIECSSTQSPGVGRSFTATLSKNGSSVSKSVSISNSTTARSSSAAITPETFAASDSIEMLFTSSAGTPETLIRAVVWGHFTE